MFWNRIKSREFNELDERIRQLNTRIAALEIDLQLYVKKLKAYKNLKSIREEEKTEDLSSSVLLPE